MLLGTWPLGMVPVPRGINTTHRAKFICASAFKGREKRKRAVLKKAYSFICSRDASYLELRVR